MRDQKTVLITGSSSGFGHGVALAAAARGHTVFATMRETEDRNAAVAASLARTAEAEGWDLHVLDLDVADEKSVERAVSCAVAAAGSPDVVINNAGVGALGVLEGFTVEQMRRLFEVNVLGAFRVNRAVLPHMRLRGVGRIVYVSSGLGRFVLPFMAPYVSTKFALEGMAEAAAHELRGEGIDTTIVEPGAFGTSFVWNMLSPDEGERIAQYGPGKDLFAGMVRGLEEAEYQGPRLVVDALVALIEAEPGSGPLRLAVGADATAACGRINEAQAATQDEITGRLRVGEPAHAL